MMRALFLSALFLFPLTSCLTQQVAQEVAQLNAHLRETKYQQYLEGARRHELDFQTMLAQGTRAEWYAEYSCCGGEETLPSRTKLPEAEFRELVTLLKQAKPVPMLTMEQIQPEFEYIVNEHGIPESVYRVIPHHFSCGRAYASLSFYNAQGEQIDEWYRSSVGKESLLPEYATQQPLERPHFYLPDEAYNRLMALPVSAAFNQKVQAINDAHHL